MPTVGENATIKTSDGTVIKPEVKQRAGPSKTFGGIMDAAEYAKLMEENETLVELKTEKDKDDCLIKRTRKKPGRFRMQANHDKTPGRVQYTSGEEIKKMNAANLKKQAEEALPDFKKELGNQPSQWHKIIFILYHIKVYYALYDITYFTRRRVRLFLSELGNEIGQGSFDQAFGPIQRGLLKRDLMITQKGEDVYIDEKGEKKKEKTNLIRLNEQFFDTDVDSWKDILYREANPIKDEITESSTHSSQKSNDFEIQDAGEVPLTGSSKTSTSRTEPLLSITINAYTIEELNAVLKRLGTG